MKDTTFGFIGLGLIGGSIAKGIKRACPDARIMAYMRTRAKLEQAQADGIVDVILDGIGEPLRECDIIFLCTPVEYNAQYLTQIRPFLRPGALISDVGSTKEDITALLPVLVWRMCLWADILWPVLKRPDMRTLPTIF